MSKGSSTTLGVKGGQGIDKNKEKKKSAAAAPPLPKPYVHLLTDRRTERLFEEFGGLVCPCGTKTWRMLLPQFLPVHPKWVCPDCHTNARCLICNERSALPKAEPPFATRGEEIALYYCANHLGAVGPDPKWESPQ